MGHKVLPFLGKDAPAPLGSEQGGRLAAIFDVATDEARAHTRTHTYTYTHTHTHTHMHTHTHTQRRVYVRTCVA